MTMSSFDERSAELKEHERLAAVILDGMYQFVALLSPGGDILEVNRAALEGAGHQVQEIRGKPFWTARWWQVSEQIQEELRAAIRRAAAGEFVRYEVDIYGEQSGLAPITIDFSLQPIPGQSGEVEYLLAEGRNISERKLAEEQVFRQAQELRVLNGRLNELDRLKTQFFANVSHEFRTPLTLMLGPLEDALANAHGVLPSEAAKDVEVSHRNALRLLKLVNTMLDFSRIEAGRIQASYHPTDLPTLTAELASNFRSICEKAGLRLSVDSPPFSGNELVYVDQDMWEKIVLNLMSNAFKFTLKGEIEVRLQAIDGQARLTVRDTGVGIPSEELPHMFERFHRVEHNRGRTHEGTGIGLALVQELVKLHGGTVCAESQLSEGSTFTVTIPFGKAHLDPQRIGTASELTATAIASSAFVEEALRWLPEAETQVEEETEQTSRRTPTTFDRDVPGVQPQEQRARILLADDNADMREYISRLLGRRFDVRAVTDGQAALEAAQAEPPDLVISDIMMPRLDGFGLLLKLRADSQLREVPIILLSARAGEESRIEGMEAGANDYLIKPFTARELLARVGAHIAIARVRREATEKIRSSEAELRDFVENANVGLHRVNSDGIILWANHTELDLLGYTHEEYIGHSISQFHVDASVSGDILARLSRGEMVRECEARMRCKDGSIRYVLINSSGFFQEGKFIYSRCFTQDISERKRIEQQLNEFSHELEKQVSERTAELRQANRALLQDIEERERLEEQLRQSQRLESMGILAAGVAHDLNNLLNIIQGYASLLEPGATSADIEESTDAITETTKRGAVLVQQLLALARKTEIKMESVDINKLIQGLSSLIKGTFPKNIDISLNLAPTALRIEADASQVNQVLLNLCVNARDAMPDGGILTLKTSIVDGLDLDVNDGLQAEGYVAIQITDTGTGMDKNVQSKIFEPFFTTKEIGKGTGLGLAVAYGIVKSHNGCVNVKSEPMQGTTFFLYFPAMSVAE